MRNRSIDGFLLIASRVKVFVGVLASSSVLYGASRKGVCSASGLACDVKLFSMHAFNS